MNTRISMISAFLILSTLFGEPGIDIQQKVYNVLQESIKKRSLKTFRRHQCGVCCLDFTVIQLLKDLCVAYIDAFDMMLDLSPVLQCVVMNKEYEQSYVYPMCIVQRNRMQKTIRMVRSLSPMQFEVVKSIVREFEPYEEVCDRVILEKERVERMLVILDHAEDYTLLDIDR